MRLYAYSGTPNTMKRNMRYKLLTFLFATALLMLSGAGLALAAETDVSEGGSGLPVPRFVSLASDVVNMRTGPGLRYPILWVFKKQGLPVKIIREFDVWRQIRDHDGEEGWVHKTLLTGRRSVLIENKIRTLYEEPTLESRPVVKLEPGVIADLEYCEQDWCYLEVAGYTGWLQRDHVWGLLPDETFE